MAAGEEISTSGPTAPYHPIGEVQRRKACIQNDLGSANGSVIRIDPNPDANGSEPLRELSAASQVVKFDREIKNAAAVTGVDPDLLRAIMYMETTHGYYDYVLDIIDRNKSILPMNINQHFWGDTFGTRKDLREPAKNIAAGAEMIKRIQRCMPDGAPVEQVATAYNSLSAKKVSDYGARVKALYIAKPWIQKK